MSMPPGTRLGRHEVSSRLGAGGVGEVWLARDTGEPGRAVAVRLLPAGVASDPARMQRFAQEARTVSALNQPNVLTVYEFGREGEGNAQAGGRKRQGLTVSDRPDAQSEMVKEMYRAMAAATSVEEAESTRHTYMTRIPGRDVGARRLFAGRDVEGASLVTFSDPDGEPRLQLKVDHLGKAGITFPDSTGRVVRTIGA